MTHSQFFLNYALVVSYLNLTKKERQKTKIFEKQKLSWWKNLATTYFHREVTLLLFLSGCKQLLTKTKRVLWTEKYRSDEIIFFIFVDCNDHYVVGIWQQIVCASKDICVGILIVEKCEESKSLAFSCVRTNCTR